MNKKHIILKNSLFQKTLNGGALQYVIFITVIIALLLSGFILLNRLQQDFRLKAMVTKELFFLTNETISYGKKYDLVLDVKTEINYTNYEHYKTAALLKEWGLFEIFTATSVFKNQEVEKIVMLGGAKNNNTALYLADHKKPLVVVANTKIEGTAFLPFRGVKSGYISGNSYYGSSLIYGEVRKSNEKLPKIKNRKALFSIANGSLLSGFSTFGLENGLNLKNSFSNELEVYNSHSMIQLSNIQLSGKVYIHSDTLIKVSQSAVLKDVVLVAPRIEIQSGVKGSFQAFATEKLTVGDNCLLMYPTALVLYEGLITSKSEEKRQAKLIVSNGTKIQGVVAFLSDRVKNGYSAQCDIEENVRIDGELYCDKNLDLRGTVNGAVYTSSFVAKQFGSVYQNHVYNGVVNGNKLPKQYAGILYQGARKNVVKCLY